MRIRAHPRLHRAFVGATVVAALAAGCGGDDGGPNDPNLPEDGLMTARIASVFWNAGLTVDAQLGGGSLLLIGRDNSFQEIRLQVANVTAVGSFQLGTSTANTATLTINSSDVWQATNAGGSGTVVVTTLTATRLVGTFAFTGIPKPGSSAVGKGNRIVSEGVFDVTLD